MSRRSSHETFTAIVSSIMSGPRSRLDIAGHAGVNVTTVGKVVAILHDRGLIYVQSWRPAGCFGHHSALYAWQPQIGHHADAARPLPGRFKQVIVPAEARPAC